MNKPVATTIDLMRHGEPEGGRRFRGSQDDPLSDAGWQHMIESAQQSGPWDVIVSSPMQRCKVFASHMAEQYGIPLHIEPDLREIGFGEWEGKTAAEIMEHTPDVIQKFWQNPVVHTPPGGEHLMDFQNRVLNAWQRQVENQRGKRVLIVAHGGTIRVVLGDVMSAPMDAIFRLEVPFSGLSRVVLYHEGANSFATLHSHNAFPEG